jgi:phage repressor protein C with HTH and peptisase S24 domain
MEYAESSSFGERLRTLRTERGLSQQRIADIAGISRKQVSDYEVGDKGTVPREATVKSLALALGTSESFLLTGDATALIEGQQGSPFIALGMNKNNFHEYRIPHRTMSYYPIQIKSRPFLTVYQVQGDSFSNKYNDGDLVLVDLEDTEVKGTKSFSAFLVESFGLFRIKYIHRDSRGYWILSSENNFNYPSEIYTESELLQDEIRVVGRVVGSIEP